MSLPSYRPTRAGKVEIPRVFLRRLLYKDRQIPVQRSAIAALPVPLMRGRGFHVAAVGRRQ